MDIVRHLPEEALKSLELILVEIAKYAEGLVRQAQAILAEDDS